MSNALVLNEHPARLAERFVGYFDRILVDAPCSGEGMFRKHDAAFTDWSPETVEMCARRQAEILDSAAGMLRPGGRLVYSTCTFSPEENEGTIEAFLRRHPEYELEPPALPYFAPGRPDWTPGGREALNLCCRLWPHRLRGEGHFAAVLHRTGGDAEAPDSEASVKIPQAAAELLRNLNVLLPEGQAMTSAGTEGPAARPGAGPAAGRPGGACPRAGSLAARRCLCGGSFLRGPAGCRLFERPDDPDRRRRLDPGPGGRTEPWLGQGRGRRFEEPLSQGPAHQKISAEDRKQLPLQRRIEHEIFLYI